MPTIREVSARAGVSASTVSNVLNGRGQVAESTRKRVLEAVREMGYAANIHAQQLVTQRSRIIGIKLPDLTDSGNNGIPDSSYFLNIINGATNAANELGHAVVIVPSQAESDSLQQFSIDGFIVVDPARDEALLQDDIPAVAIGAPKSLRGVVAVIDNDHTAGLHMAMSDFKQKGRKKHAVITDNTRRSYTDEIERAYTSWAAQHGDKPIVLRLAALSDDCVNNVFTRSRELGIDSLYTVSEDIAVAILKCSQGYDIDIPSELAIISAVNSIMLNVTTPTISAIELFPFDAGRAAAQSLIASLTGKDPEVTETAIPVEFVERESS